MAKNMKTSGKLLLTILAVAAIGIAAWIFVPGFGEDTSLDVPSFTEDVSGGNDGFDASPKQSTKKVKKLKGTTINVGVVTWGGYAGGQYFNEGFEGSKQSRYYKDYGMIVNFKVMDHPITSRSAFKNGDIDLLWCTVDALPTEMERGSGLTSVSPKFIMQADWSRGGDAIVARRGINNVADLRNKSIAVAEMSPSHSFLIWMLDAGGLTMNDITLVKCGSAIDAAAFFKAGDVDAAVVWSPDDADCIKSVNGSTILQSTKMATHIIADGFLAREEWLMANEQAVYYLIEGWMIGASEINTSTAAKEKAAKILTAGLKMDYEFCITAIENVRLVTIEDNKNFLGINKGYTGVTAEDLYISMSSKYKKLGYVKSPVSWREIVYTDIIERMSLTGVGHSAEVGKKFEVATKADETKQAFASKQVSINFATGQFTLTEDAKYIIDRDFVSVAKTFGNARIRIEGNTDNTGGHAINMDISYKRANAVKNYLINEHSFDPNRFIVIGNGPDKPIASNKTANGKAENRRTDFELIEN